MPYWEIDDVGWNEIFMSNKHCDPKKFLDLYNA